MENANTDGEIPAAVSGQDEFEARLIALITSQMATFSNRLDDLGEKYNVLSNESLIQSAETERFREESERQSELSNRRSSLFGSRPLGNDDRQSVYFATNAPGSAGGAANKPNVGVTVALAEIKAEKKLEKISVNSLLVGKDNMREYNQNSAIPGLRTFAEFLTTAAQRTLVDSEKALKTPNCGLLDYDSILRLSDDSVLAMASRFIRAQEPTTEGFSKIFVKGLGIFQFDHDERGSWTPTVVGWGRHAHAPMAKRIARIREVFHVMMQGVMKNERIPTVDYEKDPHPGLYRLVLQHFGDDLCNSLTLNITDKALKKMTGIEAICLELERVNDEMLEQDRMVAKMNATIVPPTPYKDLVKATQASLRYKGKAAHYADLKAQIELDQGRQT